MSVRQNNSASQEVMNQLKELEKLYDVWPFIKKRWESLIKLHDAAKNIFSDKTEEVRNSRKQKFMEEFRTEKIQVTEFRRKIINEIGKYVPH